MKLFELFNKTRIDEYKEYINTNYYGSWINVDGTVENVDFHELWLEQKFGDPLAYTKAFKNGWVRTVNSETRFSMEGTIDNLAKTFKYWWPTAIRSQKVFIDIVDDSGHRGNLIHAERYDMPTDKAQLRKDFNPSPKESKIVEEKTQLPDDVIKAFENLGALQRGSPEAAMLRVQHAMGGGVLNPVVEHVGDLTHRMSHMAKYGNMGHEFVSDKVNKTLRWLTHGYGFEKEFKENLQNNAKATNVPLEEYTAKVDVALEKYANEHKKLPVYNKVQWLAREAAVAIGEKDFHLAVKILQALKQYTDNREKFNKAASKFYRDNAGHLIQYKQGMTESILKEEKIIQAAFKDLKTNKVYPTGPTHDIERIQQELGVDDDALYDYAKTLDQGFITNKGRFLDRGEAASLTNTRAKSLSTELIKGLGPDIYRSQGVSPELAEEVHPLLK